MVGIATTPTILVEGISNILARTAAKRRLESSFLKPCLAFDGMFDTLVQRCEKGEMVGIV